MPINDGNQSSHLDLYKLLEQDAKQGVRLEGVTYRIPLSIYNSESRTQRELEKVFYKRPLLLCHETQLAEEGDSLTQDWLGLPLVTVRGKDGHIRTFLNVCRHRNMRIIQDQGPAKLRSLVCPYHQWTYGLDGCLKNIPLEESFADLNKDELSLVELPTKVVAGMVWVLPTPDGSINESANLDILENDFKAFGLPNQHYYTHSVRTVDCNWKLVQDAFLDGYHVVRLHKNTVGGFFLDSVANSNSVGEHVRSIVGRKALLEQESVSDINAIRQQVTFSYTLFPNTVVIMHPDYTSLVGLYPQGPDKTVFVHSMLVPELPTTEKAKQHFERSFKLIDEGVFLAEDIFVCEGAQAGINAKANSDMLCGIHELPIVYFHQAMYAAMNEVCPF